jgi:hypothetical protein
MSRGVSISRAVRRLMLPGLAMLCLAATSASTGAFAAGADGPVPVPRHVYAPYFETWTHSKIAKIARDSGARYLTLAFLEAPSKDSCTPAWNGDPAQAVAAGRYLPQIAALRNQLGGDVIPSFGGYSADHSGREIADACTSLPDLVAAYESVITTYGVTRLDMDVEDRALRHTDSIDRRNEALAEVERWARANHRPLTISYTLPSTPAGLVHPGIEVLRSAIAHHTRVDVVNIMTFDYYDGTTTDMGAAAISAAEGLYGQLHRLYPAKSPQQLWGMEGNTILPGIDDYPKKTEVTYPRDARRLLRFAEEHGIGSLSIWAIQRDNGGCPGKRDANSCSGIEQHPWQFSHILEPFTS